MRTIKTTGTAGRAAACLIAILCSACLWDTDTLLAERSRFPSTLELITGKFIRHAPEFYRWRIDDRTRKLKTSPDDLSLYDDIAVALDKLGEPEKAISWIEEKNRKKPGVYETEANWATFLIHTGRLEEAAEHVKRALEINPNAHFGREVYQLRLVEYLLERRRKRPDAPLPLREGPEESAGDSLGFARFLASKESPPKERFVFEQTKQAITGVLGMMRFARHDSPLLLEALGDLLLIRSNGGDSGNDAKLLACRAYLKASYEVEDDTARKRYREFAIATLDLQAVSEDWPIPIRFEEVESQFKRELENANKWYDALAARERGWIEEGVDLDKETAALYASDPIVDAREPFSIRNYASMTTYAIVLLLSFLVGAIVFLIVLIHFAVRLWRRRPSATRRADEPA